MSDDHQPVDEGELYDSNCVGGARHVCDTKGAKITYNSNEDGDIDFQDCVVELGGQLEFPPQPVPGSGRFVLFRDPQGAYCSLFQLNEPEPWVE